jgi:hypothetical protein
MARRGVGIKVIPRWLRYTISAETPAWLIQDLPGLSTLTDEQYSAEWRNGVRVQRTVRRCGDYP